MKAAAAEFIVVEGPIGAGKTTLARRLADTLGGEALLEAVEANPFLPSFYRDPRGNALAAQLFFLLSRVQQLRALRQRDLFRGPCIADFMLEKDPLFAELTLTRDELALYRQLFEHLRVEAPRPDLVIYLQAPVDVLLARIARRGRPYEQAVDAAYLQRVNEAYTRFFHHYDEAPLLIVNAAEINFADNEDDYRQLLDAIERMDGGRRFFNPAPLGR
ncbi:MAG: deoxyguanosine kinase/deoxyadenosine kinase [Gammaproteobacteria bacterium]|nr:MAG: deoxyguanosine kinase/deoxyadenosine kinase [Gammaproteobacteria bacterium]